MDRSKIIARLILEIPEEAHGQVLGEIKLVESILDSDLEKLLISPAVKGERKFAVVEKLFGGRISKPMIGLVNYLVREGQINQFKIIAGKYKKLLEKQNKVLEAEAITAKPISDERLNLIKIELKNKFHKEPLVINIVDPKVIGGIAIRIGEKVYDNTLDKKIDTLNKQLAS
ncbi:MAG: ATP synthase F1 subunit delta [bacterium]|nr:ATP synthase F1 subunit delta [bacterium]